MSLIAFIIITSLLVVASAVVIDVSTNPYDKVVESFKEAVLLNKHRPLVKNNRQPLRVGGAHRKIVV